MQNDTILVIVVATALAFDYTNGFHDTANSIATMVSTRAMAPRVAVAYSGLLNFAGAFISLKVAATVAKDFVDPTAVTPEVVFGAVLVASGTGAVDRHNLLSKLLIPALIAPVLAFCVAGMAILEAYRIVGRLSPGPVTRGYRLGQILSGGLLSLAHGTNDAQKTMGVITLALIANGNLPSNASTPTWVIASAATAMALGTYSGGWRIIKTVGTRIIKMDSAQGFSAQGSGAAVILAATHFGYPLSTTHVISGGVMGAGAAKRFSAVRWGIAGNMVGAWILTLPAAGAMGGLAYGITQSFGENNAAGPIVVILLLL